ncbi:MAG: NAD(P)-dependent oxidoreductase [Acidobacteriaceae bacterium]
MQAAVLRKETVRVGFIGLGLMGSRLAQRLHGSGWSVQAWNRSAEPRQKASQEGIAIAESAPGLAANSDVLLSCLADDAAVRSVYLGDESILQAAQPGTILLEMSTISPELSLQIHRQAAERGVSMLDAPIAGSTPAVEAGTITLLVGGDRDTFNQCTPLFESIAKQWFLIGPAGSGIRMKLVVNLLLGVEMLAIAESISLGQHLGIDREVLLDVLPKTAVAPPAFLGKFAKIRNSDYSPEFPLRLMSKDLNLALAAASSTGTESSVISAAQQIFAAAIKANGDLDLSAITPVVEGWNTPSRT